MRKPPSGVSLTISLQSPLFGAAIGLIGPALAVAASLAFSALQAALAKIAALAARMCISFMGLITPDVDRVGNGWRRFDRRPAVGSGQLRGERGEASPEFRIGDLAQALAKLARDRRRGRPDRTRRGFGGST